MVRKLIRKWKSETPRINKIVGRVFTVVSAKLLLIEGVFTMYEVDHPTWLKAGLIVTGIGCAIFAGHQGAKTIDNVE